MTFSGYCDCVLLLLSPSRFAPALPHPPWPLAPTYGPQTLSHTTGALPPSDEVTRQAFALSHSCHSSHSSHSCHSAHSAHSSIHRSRMPHLQHLLVGVERVEAGGRGQAVRRRQLDEWLVGRPDRAIGRVHEERGGEGEESACRSQGEEGAGEGRRAAREGRRWGTHTSARAEAWRGGGRRRRGEAALLGG